MHHYRYLKNLSDHHTNTCETLTTFNKTPKKFTDKEKRRAWMNHPDTDYVFYSLNEGTIASTRISKRGGNKVEAMYGFVVEYDNTDPNVIIAGMDPNVGVVTGMFQSFWDAPGGIKEEFREINYSFGSEYWYNDQFAIRTGYFFEHATKGGRKFFTFGSGVKYSAFILDFSYLISATTDAGATNPLANTMRFSMIWNFGAMKAIN